MDKHAYLIMAHNDDLVFQTLIELLDDERNDIFIHMDKKNKSYNFKKTEAICKKAHVYHSDRICVCWGGYSQIQTELLLLKFAISKGKYRYYHLLSGQDLPIKNQRVIHDFFDNHEEEFVHVSLGPLNKKDYKGALGYYSRVSLYHFFLNKWRISKLWKIFIFLITQIQWIFGVDRVRNSGVKFYYGHNWFSITHDLACYILENEQQISDLYGNHTRCCDEIFLQTLVMNSEFKDRLFEPKSKEDNSFIMRKIDWKRGRPYVFCSRDFEELKESELLFARKFDSKKDSEIVMELKEYIKECK